MDKELINLYGQLNLQQALIAVLYADHIEHDKRLRDVKQTPAESLLAFRNYARHYVEGAQYHPQDPNAEDVRSGAKARISAFFRDVECVLLSRGILDKTDSSL